MADAYLQTSNVVLDALPISFRQIEDESIGLYFRSKLELSKRREELLDRLVWEISSFVLAEKLVDKTITKHAYHRVDVHASWWQHFKDEVLERFWLTRWFVRWRPVRFDPIHYSENLVVNFKQYATFPAADIHTPEGVHKNIVVAKEFISWY